MDSSLGDATVTREMVALAAELLVESRLSGELVGDLPAEMRPMDEPDGYAVQCAAHRLLSDAGRGAVVGHKIGCTTLVMQTYLGIPNPCGGAVFASTVQESSGSFASPRKGRLGVECEIAVVLARDLPPRPSGYSRSSVGDAVAACLCAIEIVEDRYVDYTSLGAPTLIADDFFNAGSVLGARRSDFPASALVSVRARMLVNGTEVGSGTGRDVLDDPLDALAWLATSCSRRNSGLCAGEFVLLGSLVQTHWADAGDEIQIENDPLGTASVRVGAPMVRPPAL
jgi:2-keto-4-pentenoate hydratase